MEYCDICGQECKAVRQLEMHKAWKHKTLTPTEAQQAPQESKTAALSDSIRAKREELELKKLEAEIAKLQAPNTNVDYFNTLLTQQANHFKEMLEMSKKQQALELQIKELQLGEGGDYTDDLLSELIPMLPDIIRKRQGIPPIESKAEEVVNIIPTATQIAEYKQQIKDGKVTEEQAYNEVLQNYPHLKDKFTKEQFHTEFEKIKNS